MLSFHHQDVDVADTMPCFSNHRARSHQPKRLLLGGQQTHRVAPIGDAAYLVEFTGHRNLRACLLDFYDSLDRAKLSGVIEAVIGLQNVLVHCELGRFDYEKLQRDIEHIAAMTCSTVCIELKGKLWEVPICYDNDFALDLAEVASRCGIQRTHIVRLHAERTYTVSMTGFMPGQPYLSELPDVMRLPRRLTPRLSVAAGSIAIATTMTVIYPSECPAGWHIIGRTPISLFDVSIAPPATMNPGDRVRFVPLLRGEYDSLASAVASNEWRLQPAGEA